MASIFDYLEWRGDLSLDYNDFNEVDGLVLSALSYIPFELIPDKHWKNLTVHDACAYLLNLKNIKDKLLFKLDYALLVTLRDCDRFKNMKLYEYTNLIDTKTQTQFSAITIRLHHNLHCVCFRGTDHTLVGWKEDFNMSFVCPVPAQEMAVSYFEKVSNRFLGSKYIVCGHSKGGNLAIYASAFCKPRLQNKILSVWNFDGPGFDEKILRTEEYLKICDKISTFVPQSSIVGMLLGHEEKYTIVHSTQTIEILQHDYYSWDVSRNHFVYLDTVTNRSKFVDVTLKSWLANMDYDEREHFVDTIYNILLETNAFTITEFSDNWFVNVKTILKSIQNLDSETRKQISKTLRLLMECAKENVALAMKAELKALQERNDKK